MVDPVKQLDGQRIAREVAATSAARERLATPPSRLLSVLINLIAFVAVGVGVWNQASWPPVTRAIVAFAVLSSAALGLECYHLRRQVDALIYLVRKESGA